MTKNKKVAIASVSIIFTLVAAVLLIRSPGQMKTPAPDPPVMATPIPSAMPTAQAINPSKSHEKVVEVIDFTTDTISGEIPGILQQIKNYWEWLKVLDTKYALILVFVVLFICSIFIGGKKKKSS